MTKKSAFICTLCDAPMGTCGCWVKCHCGWSFSRGSKCNNDIHKNELPQPQQPRRQPLALMAACWENQKSLIIAKGGLDDAYEMGWRAALLAHKEELIPPEHTVFPLNFTATTFRVMASDGYEYRITRGDRW